MIGIYNSYVNCVIPNFLSTCVHMPSRASETRLYPLSITYILDPKPFPRLPGPCYNKTRERSHQCVRATGDHGISRALTGARKISLAITGARGRARPCEISRALADFHVQSVGIVWALIPALAEVCS